MYCPPDEEVAVKLREPAIALHEPGDVSDRSREPSDDTLHILTGTVTYDCERCGTVQQVRYTIRSDDQGRGADGG